MLFVGALTANTALHAQDEAAVATETAVEEETIDLGETLSDFSEDMGFVQMFTEDEGWKYIIMLCVSFFLLYLAIVKKFEPLLLLPIAFGMLLTNLPGAEMFHNENFAGGHVHWELMTSTDTAGLLDYLYLGVKLGRNIACIICSSICSIVSSK